VSRPLILVTNDDGIQASGLAALAAAVEDLGEVWVVAPEGPQSATSHALTLHKPLRLKERGERRFCLSGTPTDCVFLAVLHLLPERPSIVLSGINHGPNLGDDVTYSGTVSAALEATIMGLPGIAFSHVDTRKPDFTDAARHARSITEQVLARGLPPRVYLNVNAPPVPAGEAKGVRITRLGARYYDDCIVEAADPRGKPYFWIGGSGYRFDDVEGTDCSAVHKGYISVTALSADITHDAGLELLGDWGLETP